jgi:dipeptidyl aminopeptidase/acylaminoacyl peptidase
VSLRRRTANAGSRFQVPGSTFGFLVLGSVFAASAVAQPRPFALEDIAAFKTITDAAVSPDGKQVVFAVRGTVLAENRTQIDLWTVPTDGSRPARQLTYDRAAERGLRWSPDGSRIAFLADRDGTRQVWALPAGGGEGSKLTSHAQSISAFDFSPDSKQVAFVAAPPKTEDEQRRERDKDDGYLLGEQWRNERVWVAGTAIGDARLHVTSLAWAPNGRDIAVVVAPNAEADSSADAKAQLIDVASGQVRDVPGGDRAGALRWSPDGKMLAFTRPFDGRGISRDDVFVWEVGSATASRNVSSALDRDIEEMFWTLDGNGVDVLISSGAAHTLARVHIANARTEVLERFPYSIGALRRAGRTQVFARTDLPAELYVGVTSRDARALTTINTSAAQIQLPAAEAIRWKGPIGEVEGVLFKPFGFDAKRRYPLLVNPTADRAATRPSTSIPPPRTGPRSATSC